MTMLKTAWGLVVAIPLLFMAMFVSAAEVAGTVKIESTSVSIGVGVEWGDGTLTLKDGKTYTFSVDGLKVIDVGVASVTATGEVFNLSDISKFPGTYMAGQAGAALGGGAEYTALRNENGVMMLLKATEAGIDFSLANEGLKLSLK